ncbi:MAG: response regulator transcription factor [Deltaproteobacteria bacterium]|nr:response regulator transcription factor [Deltaproteobacteria bacterium]
MKILVVEDDKKIAKFIKRGLEEEKYEVDVVHDGEAGFQRILDGAYGLVILDVVLAKKDGLTLVRDLRVENNLTPVLMLTVKNTVDDIVAGLDAGADDYLKKPFAFAELLARVKALQRRSEQERGAKIDFADLCIDPVLHKAWRGEVLLDLTAKEYELLEFFVRYPNQVLTRNMIADEVWQGSFDKFTNIIDVYVNYLRKKIDKGKDKRLIQTVRGVGYILKEEG